jgi:hypothetical protein
MNLTRFIGKVLIFNAGAEFGLFAIAGPSIILQMATMYPEYVDYSFALVTLAIAKCVFWAYIGNKCLEKKVVKSG